MTSIFKLVKVAIAAVVAIDAKCGVAYKVNQHIADDGDRVESLRGRGQKKRQIVDDIKTVAGALPFDFEGFDASTTNQELVEHQPDAGILGIKTSTTTACIALGRVCTKNSQCCTGKLFILLDLFIF